MNQVLRDLYYKNFGITPKGDIRQIRAIDVPEHDILCAGFPCQPYSKAGEQRGGRDAHLGRLFGKVVEIARVVQPAYLILENVANLERHNRGRTWNGMRTRLEAVGYEIRTKRLSPHRYGIPQVRDRMFIVGARRPLDSFYWPEPPPDISLSIESVLDSNPSDAKPITRQVEQCLEVWNEFIQKWPPSEQLPSFPIWAMEFGCTYPFEDETPYAMGSRRLFNYHGSFGSPLKEHAAKDRLAALPPYAQYKEDDFPSWKIGFIRQNRELYARHKKWIDPWLPKLQQFPVSLQKLEWNCKGEERDIWKFIIQFRASGVRIKRPTTAPALVSMTSTQVPIIASRRRYMTARECSRLQGLDSLQNLPASQTAAVRALGNAVNADLVELVAKALLNHVDSHSRKDSILAQSVR